MLSGSRIETSSQTKRKQVCRPSKVDKKSSGSGYVLESARSPFGIFSSNDKKPSPSEELEESKEVQESRGKGLFSSVVKQANIALLTWSTVSKVAFVSWRVPSSFFGNIYRAIFLSENAFLRNIRKQAKNKKRREEEFGRFGCVGIASHSQGALPNFQRLVSDDRKTQTIRTGKSGRHTKEGELSGWLSFFSKKAISNVSKKGK